MTSRIITASLLFAITLLAACGGNPNPPASHAASITLTARDILKVQIGNVQDLIQVCNGNVEHTYIKTELPGAGDDADFVWHYTKTAACAYWAPGQRDAELRFLLKWDAVGNLYSTGGHIEFPFGDAPWAPGVTHIDYTLNAGNPRAYLIMPAVVNDAQPTMLDTYFRYVSTSMADTLVHWITKGSATSDGLYISDQFEGPCEANPCAPGCTHEKWQFNKGESAPHRVEVFRSGGCAPMDLVLEVPKS